jgi:hypothetical protein
MRYNVELLKADINDELEKIARLLREFSVVANKLEIPASEVPFYDRAAIGYYLHNFYNGCETMFRCIARFFENDMGPQTWHTDLLKRMRLAIPGFRPAVIDEELYLLLDDFRGFRHKFRHSYTFELDWERERLVAEKLPRAVSLLKAQLQAFTEQLDRLTELDTSPH